jgi:hypothetical protein
MPSKAKKFFNELGKGVITAGKDIGKSAVKTFTSKAGQMAGQAALDALPLLAFKSGGRVKGKKGKAMRAIVHGGEYVLPVGVKPTASQKKAVAKNKMTERMISGKLC